MKQDSVQESEISINLEISNIKGGDVENTNKYSFDQIVNQHPNPISNSANKKDFVEIKGSI
jgi:hypothetical protein